MPVRTVAAVGSGQLAQSRTPGTVMGIAGAAGVMMALALAASWARAAST